MASLEGTKPSHRPIYGPLSPHREPIKASRSCPRASILETFLSCSWRRALRIKGYLTRGSSFPPEFSSLASASLALLPAKKLLESLPTKDIQLGRPPTTTISTKRLRSEESHLASGLYPPESLDRTISTTRRLPTKKLLGSSPPYDTSIRSYHLDFHYQVVPVEISHKLHRQRKSALSTCLGLDPHPRLRRGLPGPAPTLTRRRMYLRRLTRPATTKSERPHRGGFGKKTLPLGDCS